MLSIRHLLAASAVAAAVLAPVAASADDGIVGTFLGGTCNGQVDTDCTYCSYNGDSFGHPKSLCEGGWSGYSYETCGLWSLNECIVG